MAEDKEADKKDGEGAPQNGGGRSNTIFLVLLVVSLVFGAAGFGTAIYFAMHRAAPQEEAVGSETLSADAAAHGEGEEEGAPVSEEDEIDEGEEALGAIFPLDTFVVNLSGGRYLRAQVRLEFEGRDIPKRFYARVVPVRDILISTLSSKRAEDLQTSQGRESLKKEMKDKINETLRREDVRRVYFSQFVVQ